MWAGFVELIRVSIFAAAHVCSGSLGAGIMAVSIVLRLALLPVTLRLAREARAQQRRLASLKPALDALKIRHADDPVRLMRETQSIHKANGIRLMSPGGFIGMLVQLPLLSGLFAAVRSGLGARVRFLWIANLSEPNALLLAAVTAMSGAVMAMSQPVEASRQQGMLIPFLIGAAGTLFFLWSASSAVALSVGAGTLVSGLQGWMLARDGKHEAI